MIEVEKAYNESTSVERKKVGISKRAGPRNVVFLRAFLLGWAAGGVVTAAVHVVAIPTLTGVGLAVALAALATAGVGVWAGAPLVSRAPSRVRERWVIAASLTLVGASFAAFRTLYAVLLPPYLWPPLAILIALALPIYGMAMLLPGLLAWGEDLYQMDDDFADEGWGALGPLLIGLLAGAAIGLVVAGAVLIAAGGPASTLLLSALLLFLPSVFAGPAAEDATEKELYSATTPYGAIRVTQVDYPGERQSERRLYLNGEEESGELIRSGAPTLAYIAAAERWLNGITPGGASYLFLGGGAYTLPRRIVERDPTASAVVVELDPEITRTAQRFFGLGEGKAIRSVHADARAYLEAAGEPRFDRIYSDVYSGNERLPYGLLTREAAAAMRSRLRPGGIVAINLIGMASGPEDVHLWSAVRTLESVFSTVAVYIHLGRDFPERQNFMLAATDRQNFSFPGGAGMFELWPSEEWPSAENAIVFRDLGADAAENVRPGRPAATEAP